MVNNTYIIKTGRSTVLCQLLRSYGHFVLVILNTSTPEPCYFEDKDVFPELCSVFDSHIYSSDSLSLLFLFE